VAKISVGLIVSAAMVAVLPAHAQTAKPADTKAIALPAMLAPPKFKDDGTVTVPSFDLPYSAFASQQARDSFVQRLRMMSAMPPASNAQGPQDIAALRKLTDQFLFGPALAKIKARFATTSVKSVIGGVPVETFLPADGVAPENRNRVLINLHGGGSMLGGGGIGGAVESIPIASLGRIKVIAVDYRLAPENKFPAASEDVAAVYRQLLKTYRPENIGVYGCSSGGALTGQSVAWFIKNHIPVPGAIGVFCSSLYRGDMGDSAQIAPYIGGGLGTVPPPAHPNPDSFGDDNYLSTTNPHDPLAIPAASEDMLKAFPPTLFVTGTRAPEMSSAVTSHNELLSLGVTSQLLVFDGEGHGFYTADFDSPETMLANKLIVAFFEKHLGQKTPGRRKP
jgi:acetyl esterase/lipase